MTYLERSLLCTIRDLCTRYRAGGTFFICEWHNICYDPVHGSFYQVNVSSVEDTESLAAGPAAQPNLLSVFTSCQFLQLVQSLSIVTV